MLGFGESTTSLLLFPTQGEVGPQVKGRQHQAFDEWLFSVRLNGRVDPEEAWNFICSIHVNSIVLLLTLSPGYHTYSLAEKSKLGYELSNRMKK